MKPTLFSQARTKAILLLFGLVISTTLLSQSAAAQATYTYTGNPFTLFSCGPSITNGTVTGTLSCSTPAPTNQFTSYVATDHVVATLTLSDPLPANMAITDVRNFAGFHLSMNDGQHTVTELDQAGMFAEVATDANGQISQWRLVINTGGTLNGGIATSKSAFVFDQGVLACCDPTVSGNIGYGPTNPGSWSSGSSITPAQAVSNLINSLSNPLLALSPGQINSLTDKLENALVSIQTGQNKKAINQLNSFISSVQSSLKTGKITPAAASTLITAANNIISMLS